MFQSFGPRHLTERWHALAGYQQSHSGVRVNRQFGSVKGLAEERLAYVYGTKLFIQDVATIYRIFSNWKRRADQFLANTGTIRKSYKTPLTVDTSFQTLGVSSLPVFDVENSSIAVQEISRVECHAALAYTVMVPELKGFLARLAQLSDSYGVRLDAGIVWDAIPLSFTVDWFINVSEYLHNNWSRDWFKMDVKLLEYGHSAKIQYTRQLLWNRPTRDNHTASDTSAVTLFQWDFSFYRRVRSDPPVFTKSELEILDKGWKLNRIINAAALTIQRAKLPSQKYLKGRAKRLAKVAFWQSQAAARKIQGMINAVLSGRADRGARSALKALYALLHTVIRNQRHL
jgi:hypothetical protein